MAIEEDSRLDVRLDETYCAPGVDFVRELCEGYDLSKLAYLKLAPGSVAGARIYGVRRSPGKRDKTKLTREKYRISCSVSGPFPDAVIVRRPPLYRNDDGSWPALPLDERIHVTGSVVTGSPPAKAWMRIGGITDLEDVSEAVVWIASHELFHYLRATRQIAGRNTETEADRFADEVLEEYRNPGVESRRTRDLSHTTGSGV